MKGPEPAEFAFIQALPKSPLVSCAMTTFLSTTEPTPEDISGLYAHFIGGRRVHPDGSPDLVRNNPAAADQVLGSLRSADLELVQTFQVEAQ